MKKLLLLSFASLLAIGCNNDDDNSPSNGDGSLFHAWTLINVDGGFAGTNDNFNEGVIVWTFNQQAGTVTVVNNNTNEAAVDYFESGTYEFEFVPNEISPEQCSESLNIDTTEFGCYDIQGTQMTLNQHMADGYVLTFERAD